ncbi:hypothetical protein C8R45DRAFT_945743 [Mycena sanguinolenta]|nr:hypothetical protein C8R45DRAFT_945743 [Mycena sanguinolenta]
MPNPKGKNGYGDKGTPSDEELEQALRRYAAQNLPQEMRISNLKSHLNYSIRLTKLKELNVKFKIPRIRKPPAMEVCRQAVIDKFNIFDTLIRDTIRKIMVEHFPLGFDNRFPGKKKSPVLRTALNANGPFHEVSSDGHEKLGKQALDMGDIALLIYGYKDKWSDKIPFLQCVPNSRTAAAIGHLFLDFIQETGDDNGQGSEIGWQYAIQDAFRNAFALDIDVEVYPVCRLIKSVHNTIIEAFWRWLKEKMGLNLKTIILLGKEERIFSADVKFHLPLFYWIFVPLLQAQLDEFCVYWNNHRVRTQKDKNMPSGHVPADAFSHPANYGGLDCRIHVPPAAVEDMRNILTAEVGPKDEHLSWFGAEFGQVAQGIYEQIGKPTLSLETAWDVFQKMVPLIADVVEL